jgi:diguanylate cyclase (GGDEF)-like protein
VIAAVAATIALYLAVIAFGPRTTRPMVVFGDLALVPAPAFAATACLIAYRRVAGSARYGWALIGAGMASWLVGELIWCYLELVRHWSVPYPSLADVFYLLALPLWIAGLVTLFRARPGTVRAFLDALIVSASLLYVSWAFIVGPIIDQGRGSRLETAVALAYPLGDVALITMALILLFNVAPDQREPFGLLVAGALLFVLSDAIFVDLAARHAYVAGTFADVGWFSGFLVMGLAALSAQTERVRPEAYHDSTLWAMLPYAPLALAITIGVVRTVLYGWLGPFLYFLGVFIVVLVATRQIVDARDNRILTRELGVAVRGLQARERQLHHLAFHDQLTGLANRGQFQDRAEHAVATHNAGEEFLAVFFVDLDGFKQVNDELGHRAGDHLLRTVADRLLHCLGPADTLARLGGDEFAALCERLRTSEDAETIADEITRALVPPFNVDGYRIHISGSVGVALHRTGEASADDVLHRADSAMYSAKLGGKGRYVIASAERPYVLTEPRRSSAGDIGPTPVIVPVRDAST